LKGDIILIALLRNSTNYFQSQSDIDN